MPTTRLAGRPQNFCSAHTMASSGLVMQMTNASGAWVLIPAATAPMTLRLMPSRSSRLIPGLRGTPAVTMTTSAPAIAAVIARARQSRVDALDRGRFGQIQRLALRHPIDDVEKNDVAQFLHRRQMRQRSADLAGSDQGNLLARH